LTFLQDIFVAFERKALSMVGFQRFFLIGDEVNSSITL
jgi:hypothetical protein